VSLAGRWLLATVLLMVALCGGYVAAGGLDYKPSAAADPCTPRTWPSVSGISEITQQAAISALDGAACKLNVSAEELGLAFTSKGRLSDFQQRHGFSDAEIQDAARAGVNRAIDDGEASGQLNSIEATILRLAAQAAPIDRLIEYARQVLESTG